MKNLKKKNFVHQGKPAEHVQEHDIRLLNSQQPKFSRGLHPYPHGLERNRPNMSTGGQSKNHHKAGRKK